jgi:uncharacterized YigZ family protein
LSNFQNRNQICLAQEGTYKTIKSPVEGEFKDRGSKFIAFLFPIKSVDAFNEKLGEIKIFHPKCRHYCYAYRLGNLGETKRMNDDGEPSNTAGKPILGQLEKSELTFVGCVVVRYFGGILLGTSGLINAYKCATVEAINIAEILEKVITTQIKMTIPYNLSFYIMDVVKKYHYALLGYQAAEEVELTIELPKNHWETFINEIWAHFLDLSEARAVFKTQENFLKNIEIIETV